MAVAEVFIISIGSNGSTTFVPQRVDAVIGDVVVFNCKLLSFPRQSLTEITVTSGNHTATQSTFSSPCIPAHETNITINGFDSGFRNTQPGTAGSILSVPIIIQNENDTFWFFDHNTCGDGGVGVINNNESSSETLAGFVVRVSALDTFAVLAPQLAAFSCFPHPYLPHFWGIFLPFFQRNAIRLNGTNSSYIATTSHRASSTAPPSPLASAHKSAAGHLFTVGVVGAIPLFIASLFV